MWIFKTKRIGLRKERTTCKTPSPKSELTSSMRNKSGIGTLNFFLHNGG